MIKGFISVNDYRDGEVTVALREILEVQSVRGAPYPTAIKCASRPSDPWLRVIESYESVLGLIARASG